MCHWETQQLSHFSQQELNKRWRQSSRDKTLNSKSRRTIWLMWLILSLLSLPTLQSITIVRERRDTTARYSKLSQPMRLTSFKLCMISGTIAWLRLVSSQEERMSYKINYILDWVIFQITNNNKRLRSRLQRLRLQKDMLRQDMERRDMKIDTRRDTRMKTQIEKSPTMKMTEKSLIKIMMRIEST